MYRNQYGSGEICWVICNFFFFNDTATTEIYTLSLHDALPILNNLTLPLLGSYQRDNAGLALSACLVLKERGLIIEEKHLIKGLETVSWEGRLETVSSNPTIILDCAHNEESVRNMTLELRKKFKFSCCLIVLGLM